MDQFIWGIIKEVRPRQWIKNFALFAGLIFSRQLDNPVALLLTVKAFLIFSGLTSAIYLLNDVFDIERDRLHPFKKKRPIAAGVIPVWFAITLAFGLIITMLPLAFSLSPGFFFTCVTYIVLQILYSSYIKNIILLDVMAIAAGFVLRIYAGVWLLDTHVVNVWFLLTVTSFALFLAIGKRRSELTLMQSHAGKSRETLLHYPATLLDILTSMFANSTWLGYALFTYYFPTISARPRVVGLFDNFYLPINDQAKYMMATVPVVIYGVMRYLYIIYEKREGESPERVLLTDRPLLITCVLWLVMTIGLLYYLGS